MAIKKTEDKKKRGHPGFRGSRTRGEEEMDRGQVWSIDVLLAFVIFISVILIFYVTMTASQKSGLKEMEAQADELKIELEQNYDFGFVQSGVIDELKMDSFISNVTLNYTGVKEKLGIRGDFCIFYEDSNGALIAVDGKTGIGSSNISISGIDCGTAIS